MLSTEPRISSPELPTPVGPLTSTLASALLHGHPLVPPHLDARECLDDLDAQLALWTCFELHYRGFAGVDADAEWRLDVLGFRAVLEAELLADLRRGIDLPACSAAELPDRLVALVHADTGPSVARFVHRQATPDQVRELAMHRSIYQLKEADPHTWAIPRLNGAPKGALIEIQSDEYGQGDPHRMHAELFRRTLRGLGLDDTYGAYLDDVPAITLAISNVISLFGLHRSTLGALVGHLAAYEMTSSDPSRLTARGLRRLGADDETCEFFDVHVVADSLHEQIAVHDLCGGLATQRPDLADQILFGAATSLLIDRLFARHVLDNWRAGSSSLRHRSPGHQAMSA